jgi:ABC-2 type transport system ATP-binding protein
VPPELAARGVRLTDGGCELEYTFNGNDEHAGIPALLRQLEVSGIGIKDLDTRQSSLEDIFVSLVSERT